MNGHFRVLISESIGGWRLNVFKRHRGTPCDVIGWVAEGRDFLVHLSPPPSAVYPRSGGEEGRCLRTVASVKVEEESGHHD